MDYGKQNFATHTHTLHTHTRLVTSKLKKKYKNPGERLMKSSSSAAKFIGFGYLW